MNYFTLRGGFRNWLARCMLDAANRIAADTTLCSTSGKWKFQREWESVTYPGQKPPRQIRPQPHRFSKPDSDFGY